MPPPPPPGLGATLSGPASGLGGANPGFGGFSSGFGGFGQGGGFPPFSNPFSNGAPQFPLPWNQPGFAPPFGQQPFNQPGFGQLPGFGQAPIGEPNKQHSGDFIKDWIHGLFGHSHHGNPFHQPQQAPDLPFFGQLPPEAIKTELLPDNIKAQLDKKP